LNRALTLAVARFLEPARVRDTFHGGTSEQVERCQKDRESNMRASTAYFAGAGTVIAAIVAGVGGGLVIADMISPKSPKQGTELSRLERRMSSEPIQAAAGPSEPVQYLAAPQLSAAVAPVTAAPAQAQAQAQAQAEAGNSGSTRAQPAIAQPASDTQAAALAARPAAREQIAVPEVALANARDAEVKRADAEAKRAMEKRKAERRQQSAEKRRQRQQQELRAVEQNIREDTEPRQFAAEPVRMQTPQFRLFGSE
jgi:flagellar biosynthesis GTPase FlhF